LCVKLVVYKNSATLVEMEVSVTESSLKIIYYFFFIYSYE
jgi:hypothetical protein